MASTRVTCQACGLVLNDSPPDQLSNRPPCPRCGSTQRVFEIQVEEKIVATDHVRIAVSGSVGSYLTVPVDRLHKIQQILNRHGHEYWTDATSFSINNQPPVAIINLPPGSDVLAIERLIEQEP